MSTDNPTWAKVVAAIVGGVVGLCFLAAVVSATIWLVRWMLGA